jgi:hypothetical protein
MLGTDEWVWIVETRRLSDELAAWNRVSSGAVDYVVIDE